MFYQRLCILSQEYRLVNTNVDSPRCVPRGFRYCFDVAQRVWRPSGGRPWPESVLVMLLFGDGAMKLEAVRVLLTCGTICKDDVHFYGCFVIHILFSRISLSHELDKMD